MNTSKNILGYNCQQIKFIRKVLILNANQNDMARFSKLDMSWYFVIITEKQGSSQLLQRALFGFMLLAFHVTNRLQFLQIRNKSYKSLWLAFKLVILSYGKQRGKLLSDSW